LLTLKSIVTNIWPPEKLKRTQKLLSQTFAPIYARLKL